MEIPFLELKLLDEKLKEALRTKFASMLDDGVFSGGEEVDRLEASLFREFDSAFVMTCANGTDALELALRALEIGSGDEVIVPAMTWVSTAEAVCLVGAKPVFWDVDEDGLLGQDWHQAITVRTKAVIPVHLYGKMAYMDPIMAVAKDRGIKVIEDAAQAYGASLNGKAAGTCSDIGCLSFYPTKNLGALGEAGACVTQDSGLAEKIRLLRNHGQIIRGRHELIGRNSRIDTLQAGFLNVLLANFSCFQKTRKELAGIYLEKLRPIEGLKLPQEMMGEAHNAHLFVICTEKREALRAFLVQRGIGTAVHYPQILPEMKQFFQIGDFPNASKLSKQALSLPLNPWLKKGEIELVASAVRDFFSNYQNEPGRFQGYAP